MSIFGPSDEQRAARAAATSLTEEFNHLRERDAERLNRYRDFTQEYESSRSTDIYLNVTDYGRKVRSDEQGRHDLKLPYAHAITTKHAYRVAGRLPDIVCDRRDSTAPERFRADTIEKILYAVYGYSKAQLQFGSGGHDASLLGAACFDVHYDVKRQTPIFRSIDPGGLLVIPGVEDPHEFKRVYRFWNVSVQSFRIDYKDHEFPGGEKITDVKPDGTTDVITMVEAITPTHTNLMAGGVMLDSYTHDHGFVPIIVIPNLGPIRKVWGYSDYEFYRHVAAYYETLLSRQADVIRAVANGAYTAEETGQAPKAVKDALREGGVIPIRKDGKVTPVEVAQMPAFADAHLQAVRTAMDELGFTPPAAWGALGAASGSDRALQMAPQVELTALKQIQWTAGLERLNTMILRMIEQKQIGKAVFRGTKTRRYAQSAFAITLNASATQATELFDKDGNPIINEKGEQVTAPSTPAELIGGDYCTQVQWQTRLDRDDPQFVLTELNKFAQGAQSLYTTLSNLGIESPEDEMHLIEQEAERFPWLRSGLIAMVKAQLDAQGAGGGGDTGGGSGDIPGGIASLLGGGGGGSGALNADGAARGLNGSSNGGGRSAGGVPGAVYGGA